MNLLEFRNLKFFQKKDEFKASISDKSVAQLEELQTILNEIKSDLKSPVFRHVSTELMIAGGAIRDTVLGKGEMVKDLDIFLSLDFIEAYEEKANPLSSKQFRQTLIENGVIESDHNPKDTDSNLILKALVHQLKNKYTIEAFIHTQEDMPIKEDCIINSEFEDDYRVKSINGVIKLKHPKIDYPIDLIVSFASSQQIIKEIFDFNLCKVYLKYSYGKDKALDNLYYDPSFLKDVNEKTITLDIADQALNKVSIEKHLPRLIQKYPENRVICSNINEENQALLEKVLFDYKFNPNQEELDDNQKLKNKKKQKI